MVSRLTLRISSLAHATAIIVAGKGLVQRYESPYPGIYERPGQSISHTCLQLKLQNSHKLASLHESIPC